MEEAYFNSIREHYCTNKPGVAAGKMMSSEAITHQGKVFAFFSTKKKMVFKLGKEYQPDDQIDMKVFNPFKNKGPLNGWFEVPYSDHQHWKDLTEKAYQIIKK